MQEHANKFASNVLFTIVLVAESFNYAKMTAQSANHGGCNIPHNFACVLDNKVLEGRHHFKTHNVQSLGYGGTEHYIEHNGNIWLWHSFEIIEGHCRVETTTTVILLS